MNASRRGSSVERAIRGMFDDAGVRGWMHVAELGRPSAQVVIDPDEQLPMGSIYKVPVMVAFCRLADAGLIDPCRRLTLQPQQRVPGPTGISVLHDAVTLSLRDLVVLMMTISDNTSADAVLRAVGPDVVDAMCQELGMPGTRIHGGVVNTFSRLVTATGVDSLEAALAHVANNDTVVPDGVYDPAYTASSTPADIARLLRAIWTGQAASDDRCAFMRNVMRQQPWTHRLGSGFPYDDVTVYGKTGSLGALRHEAGVVELADGSTYTAVVFTRAARSDSKLPRADAVIGAAARAAVEELQGRRET
ncbi:serine hydrolase [Streptomyces sp. H39-S7]|uniref:serine hydrolase n=1 Tax=Streptomyces sp. H39-S7 TaxID=3004357 RepID=UPI0022AF3B02|nr:serine hydrolase [Streptomyces sp. H39-S7]MCZ4126168.1 class A beta-lactamase-related serine hydrolase [Streptomyces sp. H39-S7]